jgi:hypothetical protein
MHVHWLPFIFRTRSENGDSIEAVNDEDDDKEQNAAIRSQQTNFAILFVFLIIPVVTLSINIEYRALAKSAFLLNSIQKCLAPVLTTIANFGTVREVTMQYWTIFRQKIAH